MQTGDIKFLNYAGEEGRRAVWVETQISDVRFETTKGARTTKDGNVDTDTMRLWIFDRTSGATNAYKPVEVWEALTDKTGFYTLKKGDKVELPTGEVFVITEVSRQEFGSPQMFHFQVLGA